MREAADALVEARAEIAALVRKADSPEALAVTLKTWHPNTESWERLGDSIFVPAVMCDLAGQLMVRGSEARTIQLDAKDKPAFLDLPWVDAIEEFKARGIVKPSELSTLLKDYAQRADKARQLMLQQVQVFVRSELEKSLAEGGTFKDFAARIEDGGVGLGITADDPAYLNMVFRTNVQSAYGAGRYRAMTDPDVMNERPYSEFRTVGDARVREEHAILDGLITRVGSPAFKRCACPLDFNCRCANVTLTKAEVAGREVVDDLPDAFTPAPGFDGPPTAKIYAPTPKLAPALQQQPLTVPENPTPTPITKAIEKQSAQELTPEQKVVSGGVSDADLNYLRTGMRDMAQMRSAYEGATPAQVELIATGMMPTMNGEAFDPIKIESGSANKRYKYALIDGRHRLQAAREAGASHILAEVDGKRLIIPIPDLL